VSSTRPKQLNKEHAGAKSIQGQQPSAAGWLHACAELMVEAAAVWLYRVDGGSWQASVWIHTLLLFAMPEPQVWTPAVLPGLSTWPGHMSRHHSMLAFYLPAYLCSCPVLTLHAAFEVDGAVIKVDDTSLCSALGVSSSGTTWPLGWTRG
jgi:hypothetical protein